MSDSSAPIALEDKFRYHAFVKGDVNGFFALMIDNLVHILLIVGMCRVYCKMPDSIVLGAILPGAAISILFGNLVHGFQAWRLAGREKRRDVTAMPLGINTVSLIVFVMFVMKPAYEQAIREKVADPAQLAWMVGLLACFGSGVIQFISAFFVGLLKKITPRAALLGTLGAIAVALIGAQFAFEIFAHPLVALVPLAIILLYYFARFRFPFGLPGGLIAVGVGTLIAWILSAVPGAASPVSGEALAGSFGSVGLRMPGWHWERIVTLLGEPGKYLFPYLPVIIPMGLMNALGSLRNIESAEEAGDKYRPGASMAVDGLGTLVASLLGSCFPTTTYIGHDRYKGMGARAGYSVYNGLFFTAICLLGVAGVISQIVPISAVAAILVCIGITITAQAFSESPRRHAPAIAFGLLPAIAALCVLIVTSTLNAAGGKTLQDLLSSSAAGVFGNWPLAGMLALDAGFILTGMIFVAMLAAIINRKFGSAAILALVACGLTILGLIHSYTVTGNSPQLLPIFKQTDPLASESLRPWAIAVGYGAMAVIFLLCRVFARGREAASHVQRALGKTTESADAPNDHRPRRRPPVRRPPHTDQSEPTAAAESGALSVAGVVLTKHPAPEHHELTAAELEPPAILDDDEDEQTILHAGDTPTDGLTPQETAALTGDGDIEAFLHADATATPPEVHVRPLAEPEADDEELDFLLADEVPTEPSQRTPPEETSDESPDTFDALAMLADAAVDEQPSEQASAAEQGDDDEEDGRFLDLIDEIDDEEDADQDQS